jgi:dethiobiotin synthetase
MDVVRSVRSLFLLGTDTGVGKTTLASGLLTLASQLGLRLAPFKPVESGALPGAGDSDGDRLIRASGLQDLSAADVTPYRLVQPLAPGLAARLESRVVSTPALLAAAMRLLDRYPALIIESAGGLLSPHGRNGTPASLAQGLARLAPLDTLVVTPNRLGAINQAALAQLAIERFRLPCAGVVLVDLEPEPEPARDFNPIEIAAATGLPVLGRLPYLGRSSSSDHIAAAIRQHIDLSPLCSGALTTAQRPSGPSD